VALNNLLCLIQAWHLHLLIFLFYFCVYFFGLVGQINTISNQVLHFLSGFLFVACLLMLLFLLLLVDVVIALVVVVVVAALVVVVVFVVDVVVALVVFVLLVDVGVAC